MTILESVITGIGLITVLSTTIKLLRFARLHTRSSSILRYRHGNSAWACVTGASDGIGLGLAQELAQSGFNVVLHGRDLAKLERVKAHLGRDFPETGVRIAVADASSSAAGQVQNVLAILHDLHLTVLVNNVGGASGVSERFSLLQRQTPQEIDSLININLRFPTQLTKAVLPILTRPSLVINLGSFAGRGAPYASIYGGSKAYNMIWSKSLCAETRAEGRDIEVLGVELGEVTDVSHQRKPPSWGVPNSRTAARAVLNKVGCGSSAVVAYWQHAVQLAFLDILPNEVQTSIKVARVKKLRSRALGKR